ncbi:Saccharopine dehydrogenase-domain-containing protein [Immersiella caudata]|uniref:Saccharopine dehydrogenase-domain-containing protein n=1 Tax=Immersiella caudata TaxID=314043 RepID=A0AA39X2Y6_9PEZI|nr:Saccharopine dehydrogenase-domain-containing protein [Immersiella caudata]
MTQKKILILGAGHVAKPCVDYLLCDPNNELTVAHRLPRPHRIPRSLYPPPHRHPAPSSGTVIRSAIRSAIRGKTHVVTTSYASDAIRELDDAAKEAGITVLNEVGLDPGIDHSYAVKTVSEVHERGGYVVEFHPYCGGLPTRERAGENPLGFKFSWSPGGALLSQCNSATFYRHGERVHIPSTELMATAMPSGRDKFLDGLRWMGLFSDEKVVPMHDSLVDTLSARLEKLCGCEPGEGSGYAAAQVFGESAGWQEGTITSTLELFSEPEGYSAMSKGSGSYLRDCYADAA